MGETAEGEPIFEIRSVQLLLPDDAAHFHRLVPCAKCGRALAGPAVANPSDLEAPVNSVICKDCVAAAPFLTSRADRPGIGQRPRPPVAPTQAVRVPPETRQAALGDSRLTALEGRIAELARLLEAQRTDIGRALEAQAQLAPFAASTQELARRQQNVEGALALTTQRLE